MGLISHQYGYCKLPAWYCRHRSSHVVALDLQGSLESTIRLLDNGEELGESGRNRAYLDLLSLHGL